MDCLYIEHGNNVQDSQNQYLKKKKKKVQQRRNSQGQLLSRPTKQALDCRGQFPNGKNAELTEVYNSAKFLGSLYTGLKHTD